jgi:hypothetical protein
VMSCRSESLGKEEEDVPATGEEAELWEGECEKVRKRKGKKERERERT